VAAALVLTVGACDRGRPAEDSTPQTTNIEAQERENDRARLEGRVDELEREWNQAQDRLSRGTSKVAAEAKQEIKEAIAEVRQEVRELRNVNADNWWQRTQNTLEEEANEAEQDVRQFARRWAPAESSNEVGTTGDDWRARRDRLVSRIEARIDAMEQALRDDAARGANQRDVEETRERVSDLRKETNRLRNASEEDWWDVTRDRMNDYIDRIEASIRRLGNDDSNTMRRGA
jgi:hypothetical protein